jgi:hypothetical protein
MQSGSGMKGGNAHGKDRQYQVHCRDVLTYRDPALVPWEGDGIDVPFQLDNTTFTFDVALRNPPGSLVLVECRRQEASIKQSDMGAFAYEIESVRRTLGIKVAGIFIAKRDHQIGAVRIGDFEGIQFVILGEVSIPPGFNITFLEYSKERDKKLKHYVMHVPPITFALTGFPAILTVGKTDN